MNFRLARFIPLVLILVLLVTIPLAAQKPALTSPEIERKVDDLLHKMTLEEKVGQLVQLPDFRRDAPKEIAAGRVGSMLSLTGAKATNEAQRAAVEKSRLKIPVVFGFDVIHGYRTIFPIPLGEAASWNPAEAEKAASIAAAEARAAGIQWTFAPMMDIARDARWGRIAEGAGEDPYLGAQFAAARVRGFQGANLADPAHVAACAKHYVAYGGAEAGRDYNQVDMSEFRLRSVYLPPFHAAVEAGVATLMSSFNDLNGVPATANRFTLTNILRNEWGFQGFVVSDWESVRELISHGVAGSDADAAAQAITAGVDMDMVDATYLTLVEQVRSGRVPENVVDEAARRVLRIKYALGLFEHPYTDEAKEQAAMLKPESVETAREAARESIVLLKNEKSLLPLDKNTGPIALIGPLIDSQVDMLGNWAGRGEARDAVTVLAGVTKKISPSVPVLHVKGVDINGDSTTGIAEAVEAAKKAKIAIVVVGEAGEMSGEAASRAYLDLPGRQRELVEAVVQTGTPTVMVLMNGRPLAIEWADRKVPAILETWFLGVQAGNAIADVLFGDYNPGGKLPVTFPRTVGQVPIYYAHENTGRPADPKNRFTSRYLDAPVSPLYPFGYGLSYTSFQMSNLHIASPRVSAGGTLRVSVDVANTGRRGGDEVVQLYVHKRVSSTTPPVKLLKAFQRITVAPGQTKTVQLAVPADSLKIYNREMKYVLEPGQFQLWVGPNSAQGLPGQFEVAP